MVKNFFEYIKELIPEKGSVFFTRENHITNNAISLYQLADMLCGKKIYYAESVTAYTWNVEKIWPYPFETIGLMFYFENCMYCEDWIHFSKNAFFGAICIVATRNGITFDDEEHENLRQVWARKLENKETEEDKKITDRENREGNFNEKQWTHGYHPE